MTCRKNLTAELTRLEQQAGQLPGKRYWRSLEELSDSEAFRRLMQNEFPSQAGVWPDALSRRRFLTLMGASLALAGVGGCSVRPAPSKDAVPYVRSPEDLIPGKPLFFATTMSYGGDAVGLLVESHMGRPTKIEGNPDHPSSQGATSPIHQASILTLYDPDRAKTVKQLGQERTWQDATDAIRGAMKTQRSSAGAGLRILTETVTSPTLARQIEALLESLPQARWHSYEPINRDAAYAGAEQAFGERVAAQYDLRRADVLVSLDADFLVSGPGHLRHAPDFMSRRRVPTTVADAPQAEMNRLYVVETAVTCTGAKADHRLALRGREIAWLAQTLAAKLGVTASQSSHAHHEKWISVVAKDLSAHRGRSLVIAGDRQPPVVHLLAHAINDHLENVGKTVSYIEPIEARPGHQLESLRELIRDMRAGQVELLLIVGGNPVLASPTDMDFTNALQKVPLRMHLSLYEDETSRQCHWLLPQTHYLEAWSDAVSHDGTASLAQPLIEPLYQGRSAHEIIALVSELQEVAGRDLVRQTWQGRWSGQTVPDDASTSDFETRWQTALHDGVIAARSVGNKTVSLASNWQQHLPADQPDANSNDQAGELELVLLPDPTIYDGRFANNGWLQELPKPVTQLTWGNPAIMSPATAERLGLKMGRYAHGGDHGGYHMPVVQLSLLGNAVSVPCWIMPGHADGTVTLYLGNGRKYAGRIGGTTVATIGCDAYRLRSGDRPWFSAGLQVIPTSDTEVVACTQAHHSMENRQTVRDATLAEYQAHPSFASDEQKSEQQQKLGHPSETTFYAPFDYDAPKHKWGMSIDLTSCIGCNACIVACQAENNIPVVGKDQVAAGREMHWLRVDRYVGGEAHDPSGFHFQPLPCMHCENAPCEYVCPVEATVHSAEGLNDMVYNRCVGTRFCSNNCPYKVRRFNFLAYADFETVPLRLQYNPDVTVRSRGVMEKCTYCVQRIRQAEIGSQVEGRPIADGDVVTACQAACPTRAIIFGDMNDARSEVRRQKESPLHYGLLEDLNTVPRTTYLASLRNPNPELEPQSS